MNELLGAYRFAGLTGFPESNWFEGIVGRIGLCRIQWAVLPVSTGRFEDGVSALIHLLAKARFGPGHSN
ncbi:MAG: hypothetical protein R3B95_14530 [Nitrospirales bacterium]|nr:hypothetical protein [Nitrospirales bacterium]